MQPATISPRLDSTLSGSTANEARVWFGSHGSTDDVTNVGILVLKDGKETEFQFAEAAEAGGKDWAIIGETLARKKREENEGKIPSANLNKDPKMSSISPTRNSPRPEEAGGQ